MTTFFITLFMLMFMQYAPDTLYAAVISEMQKNFSQPGENIHSFYAARDAGMTVRSRRLPLWAVVWVAWSVSRATRQPAP